MKLTFLGAAGGVVTGSAYLLETRRARVLVDFGQFQGGRRVEALNRMPGKVAARRLDAVVLTHAHLDHCGRLPLLARNGFRGTIHATPATLELAGVILRDSAKVHRYELERENRKRERAGRRPLEPEFTREDVDAVLERCRPVAYHRPVPVAEGVSARFVEAGHMLGSTCVELTVEEGEGAARKLVFSGDLGPDNLPVLEDRECLPGADVVVMELSSFQLDFLGASLQTEPSGASAPPGGMLGAALASSAASFFTNQRSRSVAPEIPLTVPVAEYCQNVWR